MNSRETKIEKRAEGAGDEGDEAHVYVYPPEPGQVLGSLEARAGKTAVFFSVVPVFPFHFCIMAPLPVGLNGLVRYCVRRKITDS